MLTISDVYFQTNAQAQSTSCFGNTDKYQGSSSCLDLNNRGTSGYIQLFLSLNSMSEIVSGMNIFGMSDEDPEFIAAKRIMEIARDQEDSHVIVKMQKDPSQHFDCSIYDLKSPSSIIDIFIDKFSAEASDKTCQDIKNSIYTFMTYSSATLGIRRVFQYAGFPFNRKNLLAEAYLLYGKFGSGPEFHGFSRTTKDAYVAQAALTPEARATAAMASKFDDAIVTIYLPTEEKGSVKGTLRANFAPKELSHHGEKARHFIISKFDRDLSEKIHKFKTFSEGNPIAISKLETGSYVVTDKKRVIPIDFEPFQIQEIQRFFEYSSEFNHQLVGYPEELLFFFNSLQTSAP